MVSDSSPLATLWLNLISSGCAMPPALRLNSTPTVGALEPTLPFIPVIQQLTDSQVIPSVRIVRDFASYGARLLDARQFAWVPTPRKNQNSCQNRRIQADDKPGRPVGLTRPRFEGERFMQRYPKWLSVGLLALTPGVASAGALDSPQLKLGQGGAQSATRSAKKTKSAANQELAE